jgi:hypothetical protein
MRNRLNVRLSPETLQQIADFASRKKLSQSAIVEAAIISFLSPDGADRREAAFTRRLDRLIRQILRLERNTGVTMEMLAVFARFLLTITPTGRRREGACARCSRRRGGKKPRRRQQGALENAAHCLNHCPDLTACLDSPFAGAKMAPIAVSIELRNHPLCIRFYAIALLLRFPG